jgi:hypothetical protein
MVKEDEENLKKRKLSSDPTAVAPKKRKAVASKQKATDIEEETPASPSATDVAEILKVMTESLPIKLSPLAPHLTKPFQKKNEPSIAKKAAGPKKRRIITVTEAIEEHRDQLRLQKHQLLRALQLSKLHLLKLQLPKLNRPKMQI